MVGRPGSTRRGEKTRLQGREKALLSIDSVAGGRGTNEEPMVHRGFQLKNPDWKARACLKTKSPCLGRSAQGALGLKQGLREKKNSLSGTS